MLINNKNASHCKNPEQGMALVVVLMVMMVATLIGVGISTNTTIDLKITSNKRNMTTDFFISEGSNQVEVPEISTNDDLGVTDITKRVVLKDEDDNLNGLTGNPGYHAIITYNFYRQAIKAGYSLGMFNSYYYTTRTDRQQQGIKTAESKIGPKL